MTTHVGPYLLGKTIGIGSTGKVKLGIHKETQETVAIKVLPKKSITQMPEVIKKIEREIAILKLLNHPHILKLYNVYETTKYLFLVMEHVEGGELFDYLVSKRTISHSEALFFFQQIIFGLHYCHKHHICHRDMKPENLLLDKNFHIKIADFGMANLMKHNSLLSSSCGSPHYASPEVIVGKEYDGFAADAWSCGVILFALLAGRLPFDDSNIRRLLARVRSGIFTFPKHFLEEEKDLINRMLTVDPEKRITLKEVQKHKWFTSNFASTYQVPVPPFDLYQNESIDPILEMNPEILLFLKSLGFQDQEKLEKALKSKEMNMEKVFYHLFQIKIERMKEEEKKSNEKSNENPNVNLNNNLNENQNVNLNEKSNENQNVNLNNNLNEKSNENPNVNFSTRWNPIPKPSNNYQQEKFDVNQTNSVKNLPTQQIEIDDPSFRYDEFFPYGTPTFHRFKITPMSSSPQITTDSPQTNWFGSWFTEISHQKKFMSQNSFDSLENLQTDQNDISLEKIFVVSKKDSYYRFLAKIQKALILINVNWIHPHEFSFRIQIPNKLHFVIKIQEDSTLKNRNSTLNHRAMFIWKNGDLKLFQEISQKLINILKKKKGKQNEK
ncbi:serine/threonine-protein kinase brsk2-like protein [Anaeramoeba ignava]|uniref:Serine/threonine-protein kinase brsk2-like protein n=1 Tax=Anaeramoeba ignava TaxID=1746090 RepID=A0A9Q0LNC6_ANAIG|nr:serine/threonine-protein kinase brsk2-like protein [Anaeramoeba ignava]